MDIEIQIRTGTRRRLDSGEVEWFDYRSDTALVTYIVSEESAIKEALWQTARMLRAIRREQTSRREDA